MCKCVFAYMFCLNLFLLCSCLGILHCSYASEVQEQSSHYIKSIKSNVRFLKDFNCSQIRCEALAILKQSCLGPLFITPGYSSPSTYERGLSLNVALSLTSLHNSPSFVIFPVQLPVLADNLKSNPGIKWQYFSSEEGIFTVFPAHKFRCKGSYEHRSRYDSTPYVQGAKHKNCIPRVLIFSSVLLFQVNNIHETLLLGSLGFLSFVFKVLDFT